ncbi:MAG: leucine-rich repeat domain-containing protein [Ruminococcus sp.]|nr:leucine-rich repeat domain-containing protein [Ruminococcus sp.]
MKENAQIYYPPKPHEHKKDVQHISLTYEQAVKNGWHFKYKSRGRIRITRYSGKETNITIPYTIGEHIVNELGKSAFSCVSTDKIYVPDSIKKIREKCFEKSRVKEIVFAEGVTKIPEECFYECICLENIHLPQTLHKIEQKAFFKCEKLKFVNIPRYCHVEDEAFRFSGIEGFAAYNSIISGCAFSDTPMHRNYILIMNPSRDYRYGRNVLLVGSMKKIRFPADTEIHFDSHSINHGCSLYLGNCKNVYIQPDTVKCNRDGNGIVWSHPCVFLELPYSCDSYIPDFVSAKYPDGRDYNGFFTVIIGNDRTIVRSKKNNFPPFSLKYPRFHNVRHLILEATKDYGAEFKPNAISIRSLETVELKNVHGNGNPFSPVCSEVHKVVFDGNTVYIPTDPVVHDELLKAFSGEYEKNKYKFFNSDVFEAVFNRPCTKYTKIFGNNAVAKRISQRLKIFMAVDALRSSENLFENREIYADYIKSHKRYAETLCGKISENYREYADFLRSFLDTL